MRLINSPGVQITEKDLSLRVTNPVGTNVLIPGFAPQGPIGEPLVITTASELESIYGLPATPAERYFYYSCREVLNSPAILTTIRLPYGNENGSSYPSSYSGLFYPMASGVNTTQSITEWKVGAPIHASLSPTQYSAILAGSFDWNSTATGTTLLSTGAINSVGTAVVNTSALTIDAGFFVLNDLQTAVNEVAEGYYIGFTDNSSMFDTSPDFNSISTLLTLSAGTDGDNYATVASTRLDFALSASAADSARGVTSVSEQIEKVGFVGFETTSYQDYLSFGVFRVRRSTSDGSLLSLAASERYLGSLDYTRKNVNTNGGGLVNAFIEDAINNGSPTVKAFVNPVISKQFAWSVGSNEPTARVTVDTTAQSLFPLGVYVPDSRILEQTKIIGNVPGKLDKAFRTVETPENSVVDVVADAGLSTIYAYTVYGSVSSFNDEDYIDPANILQLGDAWQSVTNFFTDFCQNTRKDCVAIVDPPRAVFVNGRDSKTIDTDGLNFTTNIYGPLKAFMGTHETSYAATYGNWTKIIDLFSSRRVWLPFSGYAAAVYSRNDAVAYPWSAPAGLNRGVFNCVDIAFNPNQKQRDRLYEISVNPVVLFTGDGYSVYGQKTLQTKPTAFDRINVRRLFLALERSVQRTLKYFVFEPNTDFTRTRLRSTITPLFEYAKNTEGVYDYMIVCDERNNTPDTIDNNELNVDIYLKPTRTGEFVLVNFIATRTSQDFTELV